MWYAATTGVIISLKPHQHYYLHHSDYVWFGEYNYHLYTEDNHTPGSLILQQESTFFIQNLDALKFLPFELGINVDIADQILE